MAGDPVRERKGASDPSLALIPGHWLLQRYWRFSWAVLALAAPLLLLFGSRVDLLGVGVYVALTVLSWAIARKYRKEATFLHLLTMFPYWAWYSQLPGSLPVQFDAGVSEFALLLVFPVLTLVTMEGHRGAAAASVLSIGCLVWRWHELQPRMTGAFLLGTAVLLGLVFRRLASQLESTTASLHHMAFHDALTGLPNRHALEKRATEALQSKRRGGLLFIDLDRFKSVNDVFGHTVGDAVLVDLSARLQDAMSSGHLVARIGGDEFAVLLEDADEDEATRMAKHIVALLGEPITHAHGVLHVGGSAGVALWPDHGATLRTLMKCADLAMFRAKVRQQAVAVHRPSEDDPALSQRGLEVDLRRAIEQGELRIRVQPVTRLSDETMVGVEVLTRWRHPERGMLSPASFIELAEQTGQIVDIDMWALDKSLELARSWLDDDWVGWVAVNFSARTLEQSDLVDRVLHALSRRRVPAEHLVVELTESAAMMDPERTHRRLSQLREHGVRVAIDDFGMGYSSLAYLKELPADHVKIDRCFTRGIGQHLRDEQVIDLVLQLAEKWSLGVVAEGVETEEQQAWLNARGCRLGQGYLFGRPSDPALFNQSISGVYEVERADRRDVAGNGNRGA